MFEFFPDRGTFCLEEGSYLVNFKSCKECEKRGLLQVKERQVDEDDDEGTGEFSEEITYKHHCTHCGHFIADHSYSFTANSSKQTFSM